MSNRARDEELSLLFTEAHTHYAWLPTPVSDDELHRLYELTRWAPTGGNSNPLRITFVRSPEAKERLRPGLPPTNVDKAMTAPVTAILAYDVAWHDHLPTLAPFRPGAREQFAAMPAERRDHLSLLNVSIQIGYLILAARSLGLDCGPMGGFDRDKVDAAFFPDGAWKSVILLNLGHGDPDKRMPRQPRLDFATTCKIV